MLVHRARPSAEVVLVLALAPADERSVSALHGGSKLWVGMHARALRGRRLIAACTCRMTPQPPAFLAAVQAARMWRRWTEALERRRGYDLLLPRASDSAAQDRASLEEKG